MLGLVLLLVSAGAVSAATIGLTFTGGYTYGYVTDPLPNTIGWEFVVSSPLSIGALGFFDIGDDGLTGSHPVSIWDSSQTVVATATVGTGDPLASRYRWATITPVILSVGTYRIGAMIDDDDSYYSEADSITTMPGVTYVGGVFSTGGFSYPNEIAYTNNGRFGPNFMADAGAVPEPATFGTMALCLAGLAAALKSRRSSR